MGLGAAAKDEWYWQLGFSYNYPKFCIGLKIRKSRCRTTLSLQFGYSKWFSSAALHGVIWEWVEQLSIGKEITSGLKLFLVLHRLLLVPLGIVFSEVSDNPHLSLRNPHLSPKNPSTDRISPTSKGSRSFGVLFVCLLWLAWSLCVFAWKKWLC